MLSAERKVINDRAAEGYKSRFDMKSFLPKEGTDTAIWGKYYKPGLYNKILHGRGGYWSDLWKKNRGYIPRLAGGALGALAGDAAAGWNAGAKFSKNVLGWGAYATGGDPGALTESGNVPSMHSVGENGIRVCHRECIRVIGSTTAFTCDRIEINPGLAATFPWLSGIARNFQQYDVNGLMLVYVPTCSDAIAAATVSAMGTISMSNDQNVLALTPTSTIGMLQQQFSVSGKPSGELVMPIEEDPAYGGRMTRHLLIRGGELAEDANKQFYDDCVVFVATDGNGAAAVQLGQLYITYDITLLNPTTNSPGLETRSARYEINHCASGHPFGAGAGAGDVTVTYDDIGIAFPTSGTMTIAVGNSGVFVGAFNWETALAANTPATVGGTNCTIDWQYDAPGAGETSTMVNSFFQIRKLDPTTLATCTFAGFALGGAGVEGHCTVTQVASAMPV